MIHGDLTSNNVLRQSLDLGEAQSYRVTLSYWSQLRDNKLTKGASKERAMVLYCCISCIHLLFGRYHENYIHDDDDDDHHHNHHHHHHHHHHHKIPEGISIAGLNIMAKSSYTTYYVYYVSCPVMAYFPSYRRLLQEKISANTLW